jgi:hypothetical protein
VSAGRSVALSFSTSFEVAAAVRQRSCLANARRSASAARVRVLCRAKAAAATAARTIVHGCRLATARPGHVPQHGRVGLLGPGLPQLRGRGAARASPRHIGSDRLNRRHRRGRRCWHPASPFPRLLALRKGRQHGRSLSDDLPQVRDNEGALRAMSVCAAAGRRTHPAACWSHRTRPGACR